MKLKIGKLYRVTSTDYTVTVWDAADGWSHLDMDDIFLYLGDDEDDKQSPLKKILLSNKVYWLEGPWYSEDKSERFLEEAK